MIGVYFSNEVSQSKRHRKRLKRSQGKSRFQIFSLAVKYLKSAPLGKGCQFALCIRHQVPRLKHINIKKPIPHAISIILMSSVLYMRIVSMMSGVASNRLPDESMVTLRYNRK